MKYKNVPAGSMFVWQNRKICLVIENHEGKMSLLYLEECLLVEGVQFGVCGIDDRCSNALWPATFEEEPT